MEKYYISIQKKINVLKRMKPEIIETIINTLYTFDNYYRTYLESNSYRPNFVFKSLVAKYLFTHVDEIKSLSKDEVIESLDGYIYNICLKHNDCYYFQCKEEGLMTKHLLSILIEVFCLIYYIFTEFKLSDFKDNVKIVTDKSNMLNVLNMVDIIIHCNSITQDTLGTFNNIKKWLSEENKSFIREYIDKNKYAKEQPDLLKIDGLLYSKENVYFTILFILNNINKNYSNLSELINNFSYVSSHDSSVNFNYTDYQTHFIYFSLLIKHAEIVMRDIINIKPLVNTDESKKHNNYLKIREYEELRYKKQIVKNLILTTIIKKDIDKNAYNHLHNELLLDYYLDLCKQEKILLVVGKIKGRFKKCNDTLSTMLPVDEKYYPDFLNDYEIEKATISSVIN